MQPEAKAFGYMSRIFGGGNPLADYSFPSWEAQIQTEGTCKNEGEEPQAQE